MFQTWMLCPLLTICHTSISLRSSDISKSLDYWLLDRRRLNSLYLQIFALWRLGRNIVSVYEAEISFFTQLNVQGFRLLSWHQKLKYLWNIGKLTCSFCEGIMRRQLGKKIILTVTFMSWNSPDQAVSPFPFLSGYVWWWMFSQSPFFIY